MAARATGWPIILMTAQATGWSGSLKVAKVESLSISAGLA
jgi:hypothetical protein